MLGPLKFGLQPATVKAAVAPGRFELELTTTLSPVSFFFSAITLRGPPGATASLNYNSSAGSPTQTSFTIPPSGIITRENIPIFVSNSTLTGSNLITEMYIRAKEYYEITGITGTYPTTLKTLQVGFNYADPVFTPPINLEGLLFAGMLGPSTLTTGSNLTRLDFPPNLASLNASASTKLTTLPTLPAGLETLYTPPGVLVLSGVVPNLTYLDISRSTKLTTVSIPGAKVTSLTPPPTCTTLNVSGCTGLTSLTVPPKVTTLNISNCTGITSLTFPPVLTTLRIDGSGLTSLDLSKTNVSILNMPPSMDAQLKTVLFGTKLKPSGLFRFEVPEDGVWTLY